MYRRNFLRATCGALLLGIPELVLRATPPKAGDAFPDLASAGLEGKLPDLAGKVVIVDFWASWCVTCKKVMPMLAELQRKYGDKGLVIIGVSVDEEKSHMDEYLRRFPMPFVIVRDPKGKLAERLDMQSLPTSFVLRPDRRIHAVHQSFEGEKTRTRFTAQVEELLKSK